MCAVFLSTIIAFDMLWNPEHHAPAFQPSIGLTFFAFHDDYSTFTSSNAASTQYSRNNTRRWKSGAIYNPINPEW